MGNNSGKNRNNVDKSTKLKLSNKKKSHLSNGRKRTKSFTPAPKFNEQIRLNKYIASAGICSRREADVLIATGVVSVNGKVITEMGYRVKPGDIIKYDGETIKSISTKYVLLNKPKSFSCRHTSVAQKNIFSLVKKVAKENIEPIERLKREFTGLILLTNDNDLHKKLSHPNQRLTRIVHLRLNRNFTIENLRKLETGFFIDDQLVKVEKASFVEGKSGNEIGIEFLKGGVKIIEKLMDLLDYQILNLDVVRIGPLTKKDLPRGICRILTENELGFLKMN